MGLIILRPKEIIKPTKEEIEAETLKLITVFADIKQRVLKENRNHRQYNSVIHL